MVKHIILWRLKDSVNDPGSVKMGIKAGLEGLCGIIDGLISVRVITDGLPSSTADLMLDTSFRDTESLKAYANDPAHLAVANAKVRPYVETRLCIDYQE